MIIANVLQATVSSAPAAASGASVPASGAVAGSAGGFAAHLPQTGGLAAGRGDVGGFVGLAPTAGTGAVKTMSSAASAQLLGSTALPQAEGAAGATEVPGLFAGQVVAGRPAAKLQGEGSGAGEGMVLSADPSEDESEAEAQAAAGSAGQGVVPAHADVRAGGSVVHGLGAGKIALAETASPAEPAPGSTQAHKGQPHQDTAQGKGAVAPLPGGTAGIKGAAGLPEAAVAGSGGAAAGGTGGGSPVVDSDGVSRAVAAETAGEPEAGVSHRVPPAAAPGKGGPEVQTQAQTQAQTKPVMFPALKGGVPTGETRPSVQVSGAAAAGADSSEGAVRQVTAEAQGHVLPVGKASSLIAGGATPAAPGASLNENADEALRATALGTGADANPDKAAARQAQASAAGGEVDKNNPMDAGAKGGLSQSAAPRSVAGQASAAALRGVEAVEVDVRATIAVTGNEGAKASSTASADATAATEKAQASARVATMVPGLTATGRRSADGGVIGAAAAVTPTDAQEGVSLSGREGHVAGEPLAGDDAEQSAERKPIANGNGVPPGRSDQTTSPTAARPGVSAAALAFAAAVREQGGATSETDADGVLEFGRAEPMPGSSASHAMARGTAPQPLPQHAAAASVQVASEVARQASKGVNRFQIRLDPAELGRIDVDMKIGADGTVRAHLAVERSETLDMFLRDQRGLERALDAAGLKLDGGSLQFSLKDQGGFAGFGRDGAAEQMADTGGTAHEAAAAGEAADASVLPARVHVDGASGALDIQI